MLNWIVWNKTVLNRTKLYSYANISCLNRTVLTFNWTVLTF